MLDPSYCEVGFGIANSNDFISNGPQTIVAGHYATPSSGCNAVTPPPPPAPAPAVVSPQPPPAPKPTTPQAQPSPRPVAPQTPAASPEPAPTEQPKTEVVVEAPVDSTNTAITVIGSSGQETKPSRILVITRSQFAASIASALLVAFIGAYAMKHAIGVRRVLASGETWVLHHPSLDFFILGMILLLFYLSQAVGGVVR